MALGGANDGRGWPAEGAGRGGCCRVVKPRGRGQRAQPGPGLARPFLVEAGLGQGLPIWGGAWNGRANRLNEAGVAAHPRSAVAGHGLGGPGRGPGGGWVAGRGLCPQSEAGPQRQRRAAEDQRGVGLPPGCRRAGAGPATGSDGPPPARAVRPPQCATASTWCCPPGPEPPAVVRVLPACSPLPWGGWASCRGARRAAMLAGVGVPRADRPAVSRASVCLRGYSGLCLPPPARIAFYLPLSLGLPSLILSLQVADSYLPLTLSLPASFSVTHYPCLSLPLCHCPSAVTLWEVVLSMEVAAWGGPHV